jgi:hypothetical protein
MLDALSPAQRAKYLEKKRKDELQRQMWGSVDRLAFGGYRKRSKKKKSKKRKR